MNFNSCISNFEDFFKVVRIKKMSLFFKLLIMFYGTKKSNASPQITVYLALIVLNTD